MRVGAFYPWGRYAETNPRGLASVRAFAQGARRHGHVVLTLAQNRGYHACDIAVMWGTAKRTMPETRCRDEIVAAHGERPFVRMERGYMDRERYDSVGLGGLWGHGDYRNEHSPRDRFDRLGLCVAPWRQRPRGYTLVLGQVPWDTAVQHIDFEGWARSVCTSLQAHWPTHPVRFRPHPIVRRTCPLAEDLGGAWCAIARTSTSAVDALLAGVPTIVMDRGSICWRLCGRDSVQSIRRPPHPPRERFFRDLAYTQWTHDEMKRGEAWAHLFRS